MREEKGEETEEQEGGEKAGGEQMGRRWEWDSEWGEERVCWGAG